MLTRKQLSDDILMNFLMAPRYRVYRHFVLVFFISMISYNLAHFTFYENHELLHRAILIETAGSLALFLGVIYLNIYVLIPRLMLKKRYKTYGLLLCTIIACLITLTFSYDYCTYKWYGVEFGRYSYFNRLRFLPLEITANFFLYMVCCIGPAMITLLRHWIEYGQRASELKKENLQSELERLKTQVNPQFLLNMLSKAADLAVVNPKQTSTILVQLGKLLRYQLYDSNRDKVLLSADLSFLENFLNLKKTLYPDLNFTITKEGPVNFILIPPLLFIPFVEDPVRYIHLSFHATNGKLDFCCISSPLYRDQNKLDNIRRRLDILYEKYNLQEIQEKTESKIRMQITW